MLLIVLLYKGVMYAYVCWPQTTLGVLFVALIVILFIIWKKFLKYNDLL